VTKQKTLALGAAAAQKKTQPAGNKKSNDAQPFWRLNEAETRKRDTLNAKSATLMSVRNRRIEKVSISASHAP
jgi:hypothetical protein